MKMLNADGIKCECEKDGRGGLIPGGHDKGKCDRRADVLYKRGKIVRALCGNCTFDGLEIAEIKYS